MHNQCFGHYNQNKVYLPLLVAGGKEQFDKFLNNITERPWLGFRGLSITIPHKTNALDYVVRSGGYVEPLTAKIGAANTLTVGLNERVSAYNTDAFAALDTLLSAMQISRVKLHGIGAAVIGAGGVARAVVAALDDIGAKMTIYNRTISKAKQLAEEFNCSCSPIDELPQVDAKVIINCTSIGMHPDVESSPVGQDILRAEMTVFDTVYNPLETKLLKQAGSIGCKTANGADMFIHQAAEQFRLFTGVRCDENIIREIVYAHLLKY